MDQPLARDVKEPAPRDDAARALLEVVAGLLRESLAPGARPPEPSLDSSLERDLGIDSLARVELLLRVENAFDVRLPERLLASAQTPRDLLAAVLAGTPHAAEALAPSPIARDTAQVPDRAATLVEVLDWHVERHPNRVHAIVLAEDGEHEAERITYASLRAQGGRVAAGLDSLGVDAGDAVAIMLPTSGDFFRAFAGILLAGAIPVPIYPPLRRAELAEHLRRQAGILANCGAVLLVTVDEARPAASALRSLVPTLRGMATVEALSASAEPAALPVCRPEDVALLQYTSGSTGDPKGVVLTHANLMANLEAMGSAAGAGPDDTFVSWLPLYHDMGLIGAWMGALRFAFPLVVMPPTAFINHPAQWLRALHRYRGTISAGPNFAYEICATRVDARDLEGLDLSAWRLAFNGAEPVAPDTLERFAARFAPHGLRREALTPVYGLAECSLGVAFPPLERGPLIDRVDRAALAASGEARPAGPDDLHALRFASCGAAIPRHELRVVGADGREAAERIEGPIEFRGPGATSGYFRNAAKTAALFEWLRTGDVGYIAHGEIFVTSRVKDLIIRGGQHVHPYEIEVAVGAVPGVRKGCVAVFGVPDRASGTERVVVLAETRAPAEEQEALRARVAQAALEVLGSSADEVVLAPPHTILKTSSGKIRRAASRDLYLRGLPRGGRASAWWTLARFVAAVAAGRARRAAAAVSQALYTAWLGLISVPLVIAALAVSCLPASRARWLALRGLARALLRASGIPVSAHLEALPGAGPAVLVANHASYLDGVLLFALLPHPVEFVAKRELASQPLFARLLRVAGVRYVERFDVGQSVEDTHELVASVRAGNTLVFFPEGTFTRAPGLRAFHMGAFITAALTGAPVVPVALRGMRSVLREGQWRPRRAPVVVHAGSTLHAPGFDWRAAVELRDTTRAALLARCGEPDLGSAPRIARSVDAHQGARPAKAEDGGRESTVRPEIRR